MEKNVSSFQRFQMLLLVTYLQYALPAKKELDHHSFHDIRILLHTDRG